MDLISKITGIYQIPTTLHFGRSILAYNRRSLGYSLLYLTSRSFCIDILKISKKRAIEFDNFNFNNYVNLVFENTSTEEFFDNDTSNKILNFLCYLVENVADEEYFPADVDRQENHITADVDRQENHITAETDRQKLGDNFLNNEG